MMGLVPLYRLTTEFPELSVSLPIYLCLCFYICVSLLLPCEHTVGKRPSANQEQSPHLHRDPRPPAPRTVRNQHFCRISPQLWCFAMAAGAETLLTGSPRARGMES